MSEVDQIDNVMTLEDLFLSADFGKTVVEEPAPVFEPLFLETSLGAPLLPLASFPSATGIHGTTTHLRRNRAFATASGVAAALLIAVGLASNVSKAPKSVGTSALGSTTTVPTHKVVPPSPPTNITHPVVNPTGSSDNVSGGGLVHTAALIVGGNTAGGGSTSGQGGSGGNGTPSPPKSPGSSPGSTTSPSGSVLSPVISLVGQVVVTTGNTVTGVGSTLTTALPPLAPVTNIVTGLGGTLSDLGNNLVIAAA